MPGTQFFTASRAVFLGKPDRTKPVRSSLQCQYIPMVLRIMLHFRIDIQNFSFFVILR